MPPAASYAVARVGFRAWLFGPRRMSILDRIIVVVLLVAALYQGATIGNKIHDGIARSCASYGADEVAFDKTLRKLDQFGIVDPDYRDSIIQSRDQKRVLRAQLHCPPYPRAPLIQKVPGR